MKESTINRLIEIGYNKEEAERIYSTYEKDCSLCSLLGYISVKEMLNRGL